MEPDEPPDDDRIRTLEEALIEMGVNPLEIAAVLAIDSGKTKGDVIALTEEEAADAQPRKPADAPVDK
jgi:hypothetical protein